MAHSDIRVTGRFAKNGRSIFTCQGSGFVTGGVTTRRSAGHSRVVALSGVSFTKANSNGPPNKRLQPTLLGAIVKRRG